jgi:astacin (peptidase family M12A)
LNRELELKEEIIMRKTTMSSLLKVALAASIALLVAIPFLPTERALGAVRLVAEDPDDPLLINLWPNGVVHYRFDDGTLGPVAVSANDQTLIEKQMDRWERALTVVDPSSGISRKYIDFRRCDAGQCVADCNGSSYLVIRYNRLYSPNSAVARCRTNDPALIGVECECNNMSDPVGLEIRDCADGNPDGITELHLRRGTCPEEASARWPALPVPAGARTNQTDQVILHELGHALGLWHEFNRFDADAYLVEQPDDLDGLEFRTEFGTRDATLIPVLENYDYDSVMGYGGSQDLHNNPFSRQSAQSKTDEPANLDAEGNYIIDYNLSPLVRSRILQFYAHEREANWGFFRSLSSLPPPVQGNTDTDLLQRRDPYLAPNIAPIGTPAIAFQSAGNYDIFSRGSNNRMYWKGVRNNVTPAQWESLGCCFGSDPAAISLGDGQIDLFAVGATSGKLMRKSYRNGAWGNAVYVQGGGPATGIKQTANGDYLGAAVASRGADSLDVFVVRTDGKLSITSLSNGQWTAWTLLGRDYNVTARPAAVALSATRVQLAINENDVNLYEPVLTLPPEMPTFQLGNLKATTASQSAPALTKRDDANNPYRVLIINAAGRISHRFATGSWRDIGGIPKPATGVSAVAIGRFGALILMNGTDLVGCDGSCDDPHAANTNGTFIEPGGLWLRLFR